MPDIQLRFNYDMLVLTAPVDAALAQRGFDAPEEREVLLVTEPETVLEPLRLNMVAGAQCLVLPTAGITRARLAHVRAEDAARNIAGVAVELARELRPQHILAEIGPCGLPLDASNELSRAPNAEQYTQAVSAFDTSQLDGFFLNGINSGPALQCALEGVRAAFEGPVFASVDVDEFGTVAGRGESLEALLAIMNEYDASVAGIQTQAPVEHIVELVGRMKAASDLPILVQIKVDTVHARDPHDDSPYWCADLAMQAADPLRRAGVQFLRATGAATAAYTGALVAATMGQTVLGRE